MKVFRIDRISAADIAERSQSNEVSTWVGIKLSCEIYNLSGGRGTLLKLIIKTND